MNSENHSTVRRLLVFVVTAFIGLWLLSSITGGPEKLPVINKAVVVLSGNSSVTGTIVFSQASVDSPVKVVGNTKGLDSGAKRGFHVHQLGDLSDGCQSTGPHFNPFHRNHGAPTDKERHVGDLGNIQSDDNGVASFTFEDAQISLNGPSSIIGRAIVLHGGTDDLGRGQNEESLKTGNAGSRVACGVIALA